MGRFRRCRLLGLLLGLPFALVALVLSVIGAATWIIGSLISCLCTCCIDFMVYLVEFLERSPQQCNSCTPD